MNTDTRQPWDTMLPAPQQHTPTRQSSVSSHAEPAPRSPSEPRSIHHPHWYNEGKIKVIDFIEDQKLDFHLGNAIEYICRAQHKISEKEDLEKALWYLQRKINNLHSP